jgi:hypothetical protein
VKRSKLKLATYQLPLSLAPKKSTKKRQTAAKKGKCSKKQSNSHDSNNALSELSSGDVVRITQWAAESLRKSAEAIGN